MKPNPYHGSPELRRLVEGALAGTLDRADMARLEQHLETDPAAMQWYLEMAEVEALLPLAVKNTTPKFAPQAGTSKTIRPFRAHWHWWTAAAAALVLGIFIWQPWKALDAARKPLASLTASIGAQWTGRDIGLNAPLQKEKLELSTGLAEVTHQSGTRVLLEGPASYSILGENSGKLEYGRMVASVPPGAEGFSVDTGAEKVIDHGTEFAIALPKGGQPEVGVFRGEVELTSLDGKKSLARLFTDHAVTRQAGMESEVASIPFNREKFIRTLPSREFKWDLKKAKPDELYTLEFDVTGLVWSAGEYRAIFKWMEGRDALDIEEVSLLRDGQLVARDSHPGATGVWKHVRDNTYRLKLPRLEQTNESRWTLSASCRPWVNTDPKWKAVVDSRGTMLFESGLALSATEKDFVGRWEYSHNGYLYVRDLKADGTSTLTQNGKLHEGFEGSSWSCRDGVLQLNLPRAKVVEHHILRDAGTLLFVDTPYRNARRIGK